MKRRIELCRNCESFIRNEDGTMFACLKQNGYVAPSCCVREKGKPRKTSAIPDKTGNSVYEVSETHDDQSGETTIDISFLKPRRVMYPLFQVSLMPSPFGDETPYFYRKDEFEGIEVDNKCGLYAEYCVEKWNRNEKKD